MNDGVIGIQKLAIEHAIGDATTIHMQLVAYPGYDANHLWKEDWMNLFPGKVIVKCEYCGQFGASKCECKYCGHAIE